LGFDASGAPDTHDEKLAKTPAVREKIEQEVWARFAAQAQLKKLYARFGL
jgi:hypothetical protein